MYSTTGAPLSSSGSSHLARRDVAVRWLKVSTVGAAGGARAVHPIDASLQTPQPRAFAARRCSRYCRPARRPDI